MTEAEDHRRKLVLDMLKLYSVKVAAPGEMFDLASGAKSKFYLDVKKTAQHAKVHLPLAHMLYEEMAQPTFSPFDAVAGVALGGCHLASIVALYASINNYASLNVVYVRREAKDHGTKSMVEGPTKGPFSAVVLLEDVVTTGDSSIQAAKLLGDAGYEVKGIISIIDRRVKAERTLDLDGKPFRTLYTLDDFDDAV
jgi:orotate phosphoribosyltransferase